MRARSAVHTTRRLARLAATAAVDTKRTFAAATEMADSGGQRTVCFAVGERRKRTQELRWRHVVGVAKMLQKACVLREGSATDAGQVFCQLGLYRMSPIQRQTHAGVGALQTFRRSNRHSDTQKRQALCRAD